MNSRIISKKEQTKEFDNLKSNFILRKIFNMIKINKSLVIMKNNKKLQKRLNITLNDYKEYASKIEIELRLTDERRAKYGVHDKFINVSYKDN